MIIGSTTHACSAYGCIQVGASLFGGPEMSIVEYSIIPLEKDKCSGEKDCSEDMDQEKCSMQRKP